MKNTAKFLYFWRENSFCFVSSHFHMITTTRVSEYAERNKQYLQDRRLAIAEVTEAEVQAARGEEAQPPVLVETPSVLYPFYSADPEMFYNEVGFSISEFDHLFDLSADCFLFSGKGRKPQISQKDVLILLLHFFRRYPKLEEMAVAYGITASKLSKILDKAIQAAYKRYVPLLIERPAEVIELPSCDNVPECGYIVDAIVQRILVPTGTFDQKKQWFSGKHGCYCLKSQVITDMKGAAIMVHSGYMGSIHDMRIFRETMEEWHRLAVLHPATPQKILADKGYQASDIPVLLTPVKGTPARLTRQENALNERIGKARIVVENFFGRLKNRYAIIGSVYRHSHETYPKIFKICCAFTNFEIRMCGHGLRQEDGDWYSKFFTSDIEAMKNRALDQQDRRKKAKERRLIRIQGNSQNE